MPLDWQCLINVGTDGGKRVAGYVERVAAVAEDVVEGDDDGGVVAGVAGLSQGAFLLVAAPVDDEARVVGRRWRRRSEEQLLLRGGVHARGPCVSCCMLARLMVLPCIYREICR
jgi:hypothetical protein|uniref:Uncharacterized protein n=1 Tax=Oryza sativa subsp. japonica TaxID=39947 RepID=Q6EUF5_ORYSJ|nr:hypothetical protein [Oryza sativa Japonica Group]